MKCPICKGSMKKIEDKIEEDNIGFEAYKCLSCGEELVNIAQLKTLAKKYRQLRKAKEIKFAKWGNSIAVRIPNKLADEVGINEGSNGLIIKEKDGIKIIPT